MFFVLHTNTKLNTTPKAILIELAKQSIFTQQFGNTEVLLDAYLNSEYKTSIQQACCQILDCIKFNFTFDGEIVLTIPDKKLHELAKIITYGTGKLVGSSILKDAIASIDF